MIREAKMKANKIYIYAKFSLFICLFIQPYLYLICSIKLSRNMIPKLS